MPFTDVYKDVLSPFLKKFREAENEKVRKAILKNTAVAVAKSKDLMEVEEDLPKDLENVRLFLLFPLMDGFTAFTAL
jgi:hypothetical protein